MHLKRSCFKEIKDDTNRIKEQSIDRFFTFSKKNEEFQELLDKEYEKVKTRTEPGEQPMQTLHIEPVVPEEEPADVEIAQDNEVMTGRGSFRFGGGDTGGRRP